MRNYKYLLLVSTCWLFNNNSLASELDLTFNSTPSSFGILTPDTHTPVELKPISHLNIIKLAAVCDLAKGGCDGLGFGNSDNDINLDNNAQCRDEGFVNSCSSGYCMDKSCPYTSNYGKCVAENCPSNSSSTCTGAVNGKNACGNNCYQCCSDACPGSSSKSYSGTVAGKTACGNQCYNCSTSCPSGSLSYSGSYASTNECGNSCYNCSNSCPSGYSSTNPGGCYDTASTQCGNTCYKSKACCSDTCPAGSRNYSGSYAGATQCGNACYYCSDSCSSGSRSYSGSYAGSTECGNSCYYCSSSCPSGYSSSNPGGCYNTASTQCGGTCYKSKACCSDNCSSGSKTACNSNQVQTGTSTTGCGNTCYSCRAKTCADGGYLASVPSGQKCSSTTYAGQICYHSCAATCTETCNYSGTSNLSGQSTGTNKVYSCSSCTRCDGSKRYSCYANCTSGYYEKNGSCVGCEQYYCIGTGLNAVCSTKCKISCRNTGGWPADPDC